MGRPPRFRVELKAHLAPNWPDLARSGGPHGTLRLKVLERGPAGGGGTARRGQRRERVSAARAIRRTFRQLPQHPCSSWFPDVRCLRFVGGGLAMGLGFPGWSHHLRHG